MKSSNATAVLERLLEPGSQIPSVVAARKLVRIKAHAKPQARVDALARKCLEGELSHDDRAECRRYATAGNMIAILQARVRLLLAKKS